MAKTQGTFVNGVYWPPPETDPHKGWRYAAAAVVGIVTVGVAYALGPVAGKYAGAMIYGLIPIASQNSAGFMGALIGYGSILVSGGSAAFAVAGPRNIARDLRNTLALG